MTDSTPHLAAIHAVYNAVTKRQLPMTTSHMWAWEIWLAKGYTEADLKLVVKHINELIKEKRRRPESFRFHNLIEDCSRFQEDLSEARALYRRPAMDANRASVLRAAGRPVEQNEGKARSAADILAGEKAFEAFRQMGNNL